MDFHVLATLLIACFALMFLERLGLPTTLQLSFKGDVKRETQWFAQYGQAVCTITAAALMWRFEPSRWIRIGPLVVAVCSASLSAFIFKRLLGRVRPNRERAGQFLGPTLRHANWRESFPSSHSACAVALTVALSRFYPQATPVFWALAIITALLRYVLDAHWPSDVIGGIALGYTVANISLHALSAYI